VWPYFTVPLEGHIRQVWLYMYSCWRSNYQQREGWDSNNLLTPATFLLVYTRHIFTCLHPPHVYLFTPATFLLVYTHHIFTCLHPPYFYLFTPTTFLPVYTCHIFTCLHPPHFYLFTPTTFLPVYTHHIFTCLHPPHFYLFTPATFWPVYTHHILTCLTRHIFASVPTQNLDFQCHGLFSVQWIEVRGDYWFCWYWWNCWPSVFKFPFHNQTMSYVLCFVSYIYKGQKMTQICTNYQSCS
jgi:hypothetical protein